MKTLIFLFLLMFMNVSKKSQTTEFGSTIGSISYDLNCSQLSMKVNSTTEMHRIWLELANSSNYSVTTLIGYIENATNGYDSQYDAIPYMNNIFNIYSLIEGENFVIQGRALPFNVNDQVPLGILVPSAGTYSIGINQVDGLFLNSEQGIYLVDTELGTIHNLKIQPYFFSAPAGYNGGRFVMSYTNATLQINNFESIQSLSVIANETIQIDSRGELIQKVLIYDISGKLLFEKNEIAADKLNISTIQKTNAILLITVETDSGKTKKCKVIY